jgi:hypothetical protein
LLACALSVAVAFEIQDIPLAFEPKNVGIIFQPKIQQHDINNARTLFHVEHMTVTAGAESVHLGLPDMLAHDGESPV